jgi:hypothetical protein
MACIDVILDANVLKCAAVELFQPDRVDCNGLLQDDTNSDQRNELIVPAYICTRGICWIVLLYQVGPQERRKFGFTDLAFFANQANRFLSASY